MDKTSAKANLIEALEEELDLIKEEERIIAKSKAKVLAKIELVKTRI